MRRFDEPALITELGALAPPLRVAFAAACAERQMPAYRRFEEQAGRPSPHALDLALQALWADPDPPSDPEAFAAHIEALMGLIPDEDPRGGAWTQEASNAQSAATAAIYALRTKLDADPQEAAWAARHAYEALDELVIHSEGIDTSAPGAELRVLGHPLVQAELRRQRCDLDDLKMHASDPVPATVGRVRRRAVIDSDRFLRSGP